MTPIIGTCAECGREIPETETHYRFLFAEICLCEDCVTEARRYGVWDALEDLSHAEAEA